MSSLWPFRNAIIALVVTWVCRQQALPQVSVWNKGISGARLRSAISGPRCRSSKGSPVLPFSSQFWLKSGGRQEDLQDARLVFKRDEVSIIADRGVESSDWCSVTHRQQIGAGSAPRY